MKEPISKKNLSSNFRSNVAELSIQLLYRQHKSPIFFYNNYSYVNEKESISFNFRSKVAEFSIYPTFNINVTSSFTIIIRTDIFQFSIEYNRIFHINVTSSFTIIIRTDIFQFSIEYNRIFHINVTSSFIIIIRT